MAMHNMHIEKDEGQAEALESMGYFWKPKWEEQAQEEWGLVPPLVQEFWWPLAEQAPYEVVGWEVDLYVEEVEQLCMPEVVKG